MTRLAVGWAIGALIAAFAWFAWHQMPIALADPAACPGLVEAAAVAAARMTPAVPFSSLVAAINAAALLLTAVGFVGLFDRVSGSLTIAAAMTATALAAPLFRPALAPASTIAMGAVSWAAIAALRRRTTRLNSVRPTVAGLGVTAAVAPALTTACALAAAGETWLASTGQSSARRWQAALLATAIVVASGGAAILALPSLVIAGPPSPAHCSPYIAVSSMTTIQQATALPLTAVSPLLVSLAALGLFLRRRQMIDRSHWPLVVGTLTPCLLAGATGPDKVHAFAPLLVAFWALVALGLHDFTSGLTHSVWHRAAALACAIAVPALQLTSRADWMPAAPAPSGHDLLSRRGFMQILNVIEPDSVLVEEDTLVDLLERSVTRSMAARRIRIAPRRADTIAALLAAGTRVLAMPHSQRTLQDEGFQLHDHPLQQPGGALADVHPGGACGSVGARWISADGLSSAASFALVADDPHDRGPVSVYLGDDAPLTPSPSGWSDLARRGFFGVTYDRAALEDRQQFDDDFAVVQGPADARLTSHRFVAYLELWRVPGAPLRLVVALGRAPAVALIRTRDGGPNPGLRVCPSFSYPSGSLAPQ